MARNRVKVESRFHAAGKATRELAVRNREIWLDVGAETMEKRASDQAASRGYALQVGIDKERVGFQSARLTPVTHSEKWGDDPWFLRFFEFGTVHIGAMPFVRPGARKANKAYIAAWGKDWEGWVRRRARVR